jgi:hypothetical protein
MPAALRSRAGMSMSRTIGYKPRRVPTEIVHAHMFVAMPGAHSPPTRPSCDTMARVNSPRLACAPVGATCHRCLRQSSGLVRPITAAPVKHDAASSATRVCPCVSRGGGGAIGVYDLLSLLHDDRQNNAFFPSFHFPKKSHDTLRRRTNFQSGPLSHPIWGNGIFHHAFRQTGQREYLSPTPKWRPRSSSRCARHRQQTAQARHPHRGHPIVVISSPRAHPLLHDRSACSSTLRPWRPRPPLHPRLPSRPLGRTLRQRARPSPPMPRPTGRGLNRTRLPLSASRAHPASP